MRPRTSHLRCLGVSDPVEVRRFRSSIELHWSSSGRKGFSWIFDCRAFQRFTLCGNVAMIFRIYLFWETRFLGKAQMTHTIAGFPEICDAPLLFSISLPLSGCGCRSLLKDAICTGHSQALDAAFQPVSRLWAVILYQAVASLL